jgi:phospholipid/cholesterol/gamma-HCH transport system substrate-binding protein
MRKYNLEMVVGLFVVIGFACFVWLSVRLGDVNLFGSPTYQLTASFGSVSGLKNGALIEIAGVPVGKVEDIRIDATRYEAVVTMQIDNGIVLQEDSIASVRTAGIIGDRYIDISPGGSDVELHDGGRIVETESAINLEELVSKYIFEN